MKKKLLGFLGMIVLCLCVASCSKSNADLIKEYGEIFDQLADAYSEQDTAKIASLTLKAEDVLLELKKRELTPEETAQLEELTIKFGTKLGGQMQNAVINGAGGLPGLPGGDSDGGGDSGLGF